MRRVFIQEGKTSLARLVAQKCARVAHLISKSLASGSVGHYSAQREVQVVGTRIAQRAQFRGNLLRRLRVARGLSQEALAAALGVNRFSLSKWENDRNQPDPRFHPQIIEKIT